MVGSFWLYCRLAGAVGQVAFSLYLPAVVFMTLAYVCLFHLFAVAFRHATIIALVYALFMEVILGNLPGIVKRLESEANAVLKLKDVEERFHQMGLIVVGGTSDEFGAHVARELPRWKKIAKDANIKLD